MLWIVFEDENGKVQWEGNYPLVPRKGEMVNLPRVAHTSRTLDGGRVKNVEYVTDIWDDCSKIKVHITLG